MRITLPTGSIPVTLSSGSYYFKITGSTGHVTKNSLWDAATTPYPDSSMTNIFNGYKDDTSFSLNANSDGGWDVAFLGSTYSTLYVSGNLNFAFGSANDNSDVSGDPNTGGVPTIRIGSNDANVQEVWTAVNGSPGNRVLIYKVRGNTWYSQRSVNYEFDIYFYEASGNIDVVVSQEPTDLNAYAAWNYTGSVAGIWGVTNGTNWVDGLTTHTSSIGATLPAIGGGGLRITGGLRIGALLPPASGLYMPTGTVTSIAGTYSGAIWEMGNAPTGLVIPDLSGNDMGFGETAEAWNTNYYAFNNPKYAGGGTNFSVLNNITDQLTICGWFSFPSFAGSQTLVSRGDGGNGWGFRVDNNGDTLNLVKYSVADQTQSLPASMNINTWYFLAVSQNGSSITYNFNGNNYTTTGNANNFWGSGTGLPLYLNYDPYIGGPWSVNMREVKVFSTALSDTDLTAIYNSQKASYGY